MILLLNNLGIIMWSIFIGLNDLAFLYNIPDLSLSDIVYFVTDGKDVNLHGHVKVDKDAGKAIGQAWLVYKIFIYFTH
jgi:hypothetical protein